MAQRFSPRLGLVLLMMLGGGCTSQHAADGQPQPRPVGPAATIPRSADLSPAVVDAPMPEIPPDLMAPLRGVHATFEVMVSVEGKPGAIRVLKSSGNPKLDQLLEATLQRYRFRPARQAGQTVEAPFVISFSASE